MSVSTGSHSEVYVSCLVSATDKVSDHVPNPTLARNLESLFVRSVKMWWFPSPGACRADHGRPSGSKRFSLDAISYANYQQRQLRCTPVSGSPLGSSSSLARCLPPRLKCVTTGCTAILAHKGPLLRATCQVPCLNQFPDHQSDTQQLFLTNATSSR